MTRILALGILAFALSLTGASGQAMTSIVVGCTGVDDSTPALYALKAGLFRKAGLDVKLEHTASGAAAAAGVIGGSLQFANSSVMAPITAYVRGVPLRIAAPGGINPPDFEAALIKKGAPIKSGRDLNGTTVASVSVTDLLALSLFAWMDQHGGDSKTVKTVELSYSAMVPALEDGRIAAGVMLQPLLGQALATGKVETLARTFEAVSPHFLISAWLTSESYASANPDVVRRFAAVIRQAAAYANGHHTETAPLLAEWTGVDVPTILKSGRSFFYDGTNAPAQIQPVIDVAAKYKAIDKQFDAKELFSGAVTKGS